MCFFFNILDISMRKEQQQPALLINFAKMGMLHQRLKVQKLKNFLNFCCVQSF